MSNIFHSSRKRTFSILIVMLTLATAWALRGRFGHEYGAAWAGSLGVLSLILVSGRKDWLENWLPVMTMGGIAWGMTGMISYGQVIGYGRSGDWFNAAYGLLGLFVIGGLFGFLGGGLTGLMLETSEKKKPDWASLVTQMVAGGIIFWGFLIYQLEWYMTPPRSELWAACLGAAFALGWYLKRNRFENAWFVAMTTMLGAGFGFGFGNFIQVLGNGLGIGINWWNVMEYNIGFWGGLGMAYGIFHRKWPEMTRLPAGHSIWSALLIFILVPVWVISNTFTDGKIQGWMDQAGVSDFDGFRRQMYLRVAVVSIIALSVLLYIVFRHRAGKTDRRSVAGAFFATFLWYQALKLITSGVPEYYKWSMEEFTLLNLIAIFFLFYFRKPGSVPEADPPREISAGFYRLWAGILILLILLAGFTSAWYGGATSQFNRF